MNKKTVWISGAANGIGRATAIEFSRRGYFIGIADIDEEGLKKLRSELGVDNSWYMVCDVSDPESTKSALQSFAEKTSGRLDVLIVNAGILAVSNFEDTPLERYRKMIDINVFGYTNQVYQALPILKKTKGSHVVLISSSSCIWGIPLFSVYAATKAFVRSLTESLQIEFRQHGITVNSVLPHMVKTAMEETQLEGGRKAKEFKVTAEMTADVIWQAVKKPKRLHWIMGQNMGLNFFLKRLLSDRAMQFVMKKKNYDPFV